MSRPLIAARWCKKGRLLLEEVDELFWPGEHHSPIPGTGGDRLRCYNLHTTTTYQPIYFPSRAELCALDLPDFIDIDLAAPPRADMVCRSVPVCLMETSPHPTLPFLNCTADIFFNEPHVLAVCSQQCKVAYHPQCWIRMKRTKVCHTPDCGGLISRVVEN